MKPEKIEMLKYRGDKSSSFTGRPEGKQARSDAGIDNKDHDGKDYNIIIPEGTTAFNPSFYLGFFFDSIKRLKIDKFEEKYKIVIEENDPDLRRNIKIDIEEGRRHALNQLTKKGGLLHFLKT